MKHINKLLLSIIFLTIFISCHGTPPIESCKTTSECSNTDHICVDGTCKIDYCLVKGEDTCGKGKCIPGSLNDGKTYQSDYGNQYHCECEENAVLISERRICVPTCDGYSEECTEFGKTTDFDSCNMEKGHCDTKCQGEGSCQYGYYCSNGGACRRGPCVEGGCQAGFTCVDGLCKVDSE